MYIIPVPLGGTCSPPSQALLRNPTVGIPRQSQAGSESDTRPPARIRRLTAEPHASHPRIATNQLSHQIHSQVSAHRRRRHQWPPLPANSSRVPIAQVLARPSFAPSTPPFCSRRRGPHDHLPRSDPLRCLKTESPHRKDQSVGDFAVIASSRLRTPPPQCRPF